MNEKPVDQDLAETLAAIKQRRPVYSELVDRFQDLLQAQASLRRRFAEREFPFQEQALKRKGQGVPYLSDAPLPECGDLLEIARKEVVPVLERSFPFAKEMRSLTRLADAGDLDMDGLARSMLGGDMSLIRETAQEHGLDETVLGFVVRCVLEPVLAGMARSMAPLLERRPWTEGYCPFCGSPPAIASLSRFDNSQSEGLVGGGGKKLLTCSLCAHQWTFRRDICPACGNSDDDQRELLFVEDNRHERIEACKACGSYLLCIDLREVDGDVRMEAAPLGLVHLDLIARKSNYSPLAAPPWSVDG